MVSWLFYCEHYYKQEINFIIVTFFFFIGTYCIIGFFQISTAYFLKFVITKRAGLADTPSTTLLAYKKKLLWYRDLEQTWKYQSIISLEKGFFFNP